MPRRNLNFGKPPQGAFRKFPTPKISTISPRDIEAEIKRTSGKLPVASGRPEYPNLLRYYASLLKGAQRYRSMTEREQIYLDHAAKFAASESALSKSLDKVLFGG